MNDPHVVALLYKIKPDRSVDYSDAKPYNHEEEAFRVHVEQEQVRFEMKAHYASVNEAQEAVRNSICAWEFPASLKYGPKVFKLVFRDYKIEDRKPTPRKVSLSGDLVVPPPHVQGELTVISPRPYPAPPSTFKQVSSNAQSMHDRFIHSLSDKPRPRPRRRDGSFRVKQRCFRRVESGERSTEEFGNRYVPDGLVAFLERLRRD